MRWTCGGFILTDVTRLFVHSFLLFLKVSMNRLLLIAPTGAAGRSVPGVFPINRSGIIWNTSKIKMFFLGTFIQIYNAMKLGNSLKKLRESKGFTQQQMADLIHTHKTGYSKMEITNRKSPSMPLYWSPKASECQLTRSSTLTKRTECRPRSLPATRQLSNSSSSSTNSMKRKNPSS